ncbi:MAG: carbon-nitrogen hydrolase family protein [Euryarchaeota archaeon]|nr:carbon-nitrogen hydrolase family protein [Euryarchaeota archaeon]
MKVALVQVPCSLGDKEENIARMGEMMKRAEADLFVFAEMYLTGYMCRDLYFRLAERPDGESVRKIGKLAEEHGSTVLFGMPVLDDEVPGLIKNSAVAVSPDGLVQRYDKLYPANFGPFEEKLYFAPGRSPKMFDISGTKIGVIICFDIFFPELSKSYALNGAEAIVCIAASPPTSRPFFEKLIPARAIENTVYFVYVNQVGTQLNQVYFGGSEAVGPRGDTLVKGKYYEEDLNVIDIDPAQLGLARNMRPTLRDTLGPEEMIEFPRVE